MTVFVPIVSSLAGGCLTAENWQRCGVQVVSCRLTDLLLKPGLDVLNKLPNLASYFGQPSAVLLNATMPKQDRHGQYLLVSPPMTDVDIIFSYEAIFSVHRSFKTGLFNSS